MCAILSIWTPQKLSYPLKQTDRHVEPLLTFVDRPIAVDSNVDPPPPNPTQLKDIIITVLFASLFVSLGLSLRI